MTATFGDFLDAASAHIAAACQHRELASGSVPAAARELGRVIAALARHLADVPDSSPGDTHTAAAWRRAARDARLALTQAGAALRLAAGTAPVPPVSGDPPAAHLSAAAAALTAGRDLLQTHFQPGPAGAPRPASHWAPAVTTEPVAVALLSEIAAFANRLGRWSAQLSPAGPTATHAFNTASRGLWAAAAALDHTRRHAPAAAQLLRAIPANTLPPYRPPGSRQSVGQLCQGATNTAERLRHLARPFTGDAALPETMTAASWQRAAHATAIVGHASEIVLYSLTRRPRVGTEAAITAALRGAAAPLASAWQAGRAAARQWDPITTGTNGQPGAAAAEAGDLAVWIGRLAYRDPGWTPARHHPNAPRQPAELAAPPDGLRTTLAAVHHAIDAVTHLLSADRDTARAAAAEGRLFIPTRLLPGHYDIPYRYAPIPAETTDTLLGTYDAAITAATRAVRALDDIAAKADSPSAILAGIRAAAQDQHATPRVPAKPPSARHAPARPPRADRRHALVPRPPGPVETTVRDLGISEPALLARAASIDDAASDLVAQARNQSQRHDAAPRPTAETNHAAASARSAAQLAAKDFPANQPPPDLQAASTAEVSMAPMNRRRSTSRSQDERLGRATSSRRT